MPKDHTREAGSALILAAVVVIVTAGLGTAFLTLSYTQNRATFNASTSEISLYIAEAGLEDAINKMNAYASAAWAYMRDNNLSEPTGYTPSTGADFNCFFTTYDYVAGRSPIPKSILVRAGAFPGTPGYNQFSFNGGTYSVEITPAFDGSRRAYTVRATGRHRDITRRIETVVGPEEIITLDAMAAFGDVYLDATGNLFVDSYKSSAGPYALQKGAKEYARAGGTIGTNGTVAIGGSAKIYGDLWTGCGQPLPPPQDTNGRVMGIVDSLPAPVEVPPQSYNPPAGLTAQTINWKNDMTLGTAGQSTNYRYTNMSHKSSMILTIRGDVTLYVDGEIDMHAQSKILLEPGATLKIYQGPGNQKLVLNGGTRLGGGELSPYRFQLYSASTGTMTFNGGSAVYGSFYAPHATAKQTGNATVFGKVVFNRLDQMQGSFVLHFDEDLKNMPQSPPKYGVRSWRETLQ